MWKHQWLVKGSRGGFIEHSWLNGVFCYLSLTYGIIFALPAWLVFSPNLPSPVIQSASCDVSSWPWCVEVRVLQETDKAAEGLLCSVLPRTLLHSVPPHLCPGSRRSHAPRRLALHCLCDLPQAPSTRHHWGMGHRNTATQQMSHEAGTTAAVSFPSCSFQNTHTHTHKQCSCCRRKHKWLISLLNLEAAVYLKTFLFEKIVTSACFISLSMWNRTGPFAPCRTVLLVLARPH